MQNSFISINASTQTKETTIVSHLKKPETRNPKPETLIENTILRLHSICVSPPFILILLE